MNTSAVAEAEDNVPKSTIFYKVRWNSLRGIGNSPVARASIAVPILGYLILFHRDLIDYLKMHAQFCDGCTVSWRLHFLYFGSCFFALGALVYGFYCPPLLKKYSAAQEFFDAEKYYFTNPPNFEHLRSLIRLDRKHHKYEPDLLASVGERGTGDPKDLYFLGGVMGEHFVLQNHSYPTARLVVGTSYLLGAILLGIPTVWTFGQVLIQVIKSGLKAIS